LSQTRLGGSIAGREDIRGDIAPTSIPLRGEIFFLWRLSGMKNDFQFAETEKNAVNQYE
jgi:hypothetical protein